MEPKLKELLTSIDTRFSGPSSCRLNDMLSGRLDIDYDEIKDYLTGLKDSGVVDDDNMNERREKIRTDAETYLKLFIQYTDKRVKDFS